MLPFIFYRAPVFTNIVADAANTGSNRLEVRNGTVPQAVKTEKKKCSRFSPPSSFVGWRYVQLSRESLLDGVRYVSFQSLAYCTGTLTAR